MKYIVENEEPLLKFLLTHLDGSNKKIKSLLKYQNILVNKKSITKYDYLLHKNDIVEVKEFKTKKHPKDLDIIYEDKNILVVNKQAGLLTISDGKNNKNLYHMVREYVKSSNSKNTIFIIHRLDRDTSGIVMFAKTEKIKNLYQNNWNDIVLSRKYAAIVEGVLDKKEDTIKIYLEGNENGHVYVSKTGKLAITNYKVKKENTRYSLLDIDIKTGRKNQIRVSLKEIGHPVVGDSKYGNKDKYMYLCAYELKIKNPITKKIDTYKIDIPKKYNDFMNENNIKNKP